MLTLQVLISALIVAAVLWWMWRMPRKDESLYGWGPPMALGSAWAGLAAIAATLLLWLVPFADQLLVLVFLVLDPASIAMGTLVMWIYRGVLAPAEAISMQRIQAKVGIALGLAAVTLGYIYVITHKTPFTPVGS